MLEYEMIFATPNNETKQPIGIGSANASFVMFEDFYSPLWLATQSNQQAGITHCTNAEVTSAGLNWVGAMKISDATNGGYTRQFVPSKTTSANFDLIAGKSKIEVIHSIYIPSTSVIPTSITTYFVGLVKGTYFDDGGTASWLAVLIWDVNSANWRLRLNSGSYVDTGITAALGTQYVVNIVQDNGSVSVYINGVLVVSPTANSIGSSTAILPTFGFIHSGSSTQTIWADYQGMKITLSSARSNFGFTT